MAYWVDGRCSGPTDSRHYRVPYVRGAAAYRPHPSRARGRRATRRARYVFYELAGLRASSRMPAVGGGSFGAAQSRRGQLRGGRRAAVRERIGAAELERRARRVADGASTIEDAGEFRRAVRPARRRFRFDRRSFRIDLRCGFRRHQFERRTLVPASGGDRKFTCGAPPPLRVFTYSNPSAASGSEKEPSSSGQVDRRRIARCERRRAHGRQKPGLQCRGTRLSLRAARYGASFRRVGSLHDRTGADESRSNGTRRR